MIAFYESRLRFKTDAADLPPLNTVHLSQPQQTNGHEAAQQNGSPRPTEPPMTTTTDVLTETTQADDGTTMEQTTTTTTTTALMAEQGVAQAVM